jgi:tRNA A37 threonylcarbamoyladenosine modification protein TsaB
MTLGLAVETTTVHYGVAVFADRDVLAHRTIRRDGPDFGGIGDLAASVLAETGRPFGDLGLLAVDVGPGNLT